jgi:hypothetical protein
VVDQPWRWTVKVSSAAGKPLSARIRLQSPLQHDVVGCWKNGAMAQCLSIVVVEKQTRERRAPVTVKPAP